MALPSTYTSAYGTLSEFFGRIRDAQAPERFTQQILKDMGYKSNNHRSFIPILKALDFLTTEGAPTQRYHNYRNHSLSKRIMGEAIKDAYSDLFLIKTNPSKADKELIEGKFKSFHNSSDNVASVMAKNFYALLDLAEINFDSKPPEKEEKKELLEKPDRNIKSQNDYPNKTPSGLGLNYNIQIHLPATKDVEVYNAIFKSIKDHLIE